MDLGIAGKWAIVCAASRGLGRACAESLAANGVNLVVNARGAEALEETARAIRAASGVEVVPVAADITTPEGRAAVLAARPDPDILVNNAGGPPPGDFRDWEEEDWIAALRANMLTAIALIRAVIDPMTARGFGRIVNITSSAVKAPIAELGLSNGARSGLTGFVAGLARAVAGSGVTINNLLPGRFATDRLAANLAFNAQRSGRPVEEVRREAESRIPAGRFGDPHEFGELCAFVCSRQAGYITGQNLLIDGGAYPGTF
ncbi:MAG TPA: SDR family oxidoreductase [Rhodospirillales bacterium]|nr:SDR family oxidoreductase [Rhodospirillales bacterium]